MIKDLLSVFIVLGIIASYIIYQIMISYIKKRKRVKAKIKGDPVIQKLEKELNRLKED